MDIKEYCERAMLTRVYSGSGEQLGRYYAASELASGAGAVLNQVKKMHRDDATSVTKPRVEAIEHYLGELAWGFAAVCAEMRLDPEVVLRKNLDVLADRFGRHAIRGDGKDR